METSVPLEVLKDSFNKAQRYNLKDDGSEPNKSSTQMRDAVSLCLKIMENPLVNDETIQKSARDLAAYVREELVVSESHNNVGREYDYSGSHGISIYAPTSGALEKPSIDLEGSRNYWEHYARTSLARDTGWDQVVRKLGA
jgi:hypothetical protein